MCVLVQVGIGTDSFIYLIFKNLRGRKIFLLDYKYFSKNDVVTLIYKQFN